ncbi:MAG: hypothetical protein U9P72_01455 [Campylobacterota bacterium]|nr:hypothetical protein [Campylobacterota bacterium]
MSYRYILFLIIGIDVSILLLQTSELSISYQEASILYENFSFLQILIKTSIYLLGENDFALRIPIITLHLLSILLLYSISHKYLKYERDKLWMIAIFILSPGVISSAIIINSAGLIIFGLLLFIYVYENFSKKYVYLLLGLYSFLDSGFVYLFISLVIYAYFNKQRNFLLLNILLLSISIYIYGFNSHGMPKGYFLDSLGVYSAIFTPMIFIYLFYILYRRLLTKDINLLWYISGVTLLLSLLLSFRQKIEIEIFASYLIIALPLAAQTFTSSYRVRLKIFRKKYNSFLIISLIFLFLNSFLIIFNKELYFLFENPRKHFAYKMHVAKELANELKSRDIHCIDSYEKMSQRLQFYGISECSDYKLDKYVKNRHTHKNVTISYNGRIVYDGIVTKINTK